MTRRGANPTSRPHGGDKRLNVSGPMIRRRTTNHWIGGRARAGDDAAREGRSRSPRDTRFQRKTFATAIVQALTMGGSVVDMLSALANEKEAALLLKEDRADFLAERIRGLTGGR
jgi:hypothetical protein